MLTTLQKIGMAVALLLSCIILALVSFAAGWENMPESQKEYVLAAGFWVTVSFSIASSLYAIFFVYTKAQLKIIAEMTEYNKRMAEQFNVGACISPRTWLDADDYRRLAQGSRK